MLVMMLRVRILASPLVLAAALSVCSTSWAKDLYLRKWPADAPAPSLQLTDLDGRVWNIRDLRGKVVVLNFWATWCGPCVEEQQQINDLAATGFSPDKPVILGIDFKESSSTIRRFSQDHRFGYPVLLDKTGDAFKRWSNGILPTTVLIDRRGRPRWRIIGALDPADTSLKQVLERMLAEPAPAKAGKAIAPPK